MTPSETPLRCDTFRERLYAFQADELPGPERQRFQDHLNRCPDCARRLEIEDGFGAALKRGLRRQSAPEELRARVRAALEREAHPFRSAGRRSYLGWAGALAASLLLALVLIQGVRGLRLPAVSAESVPAARIVTVVDLDCDQEGRSLAEQRRCLHPHHLNALKLEDGSYWNLTLEQPRARWLATNVEMRGHRLWVEGRLFERLHTLRLDRFEDLGLYREVAARALP